MLSEMEGIAGSELHACLYEDLAAVFGDVEKSVLLTDNLKNQYEEKIVSLCQKIDLAVNSTVYSKNKECCKACEYCKICN